MLVNYDKIDGSVKSKETHQGYNDESDWTRGQAWGLYGYTMSYRETNDPAFLEQAEKIASFIINNPNLPSDLIPYWDFKDPTISTNPSVVPRDVSAATIVASALIELSVLTTDAKYMVIASKILNTLSQPEYNTGLSSNNNFILLQSTGSKPGNSEVNTSLNYADYYYLEALTRYKYAMGIDFEPYTIYTDIKSIDANSEFVDNIIVYDIDNVGGFTVSLKNNPSFVVLKELGDNKYETTASPTNSDVGNHKFYISINYEDGTVVDKVVEYDVISTLGVYDNTIKSKYKVYTIDDELLIEGVKDSRQITVYTAFGTIVIKNDISLINGKEIVNISSLISGVYIYVIETTSGLSKGKFIIR